jgi:hypothetical protein
MCFKFCCTSLLINKYAGFWWLLFFGAIAYLLGTIRRTRPSGLVSDNLDVEISRFADKSSGIEGRGMPFNLLLRGRPRIIEISFSREAYYCLDHVVGLQPNEVARQIAGQIDVIEERSAIEAWNWSYPLQVSQ